MTLSTTALAHYDAPKLAAALERAEARIRQLEQENSALRTELRWIDRLLAVPASIMSPSHKVTLRAAVKAYQRGTPDEHGLIQIESWKLCKTVGQSRQTFLDNLTYCVEKLGILTKKRERLVESDTNDYTTNLYIGVTPLLAHPQAYKVDTPRNHGGERQLCPHCHSDRLQRKVTITCMNCGSVLDEKMSLVNQGDHLDDAPESRVNQAENMHVQDDRESTPNTNSNLTSSKTTVLERQLDDSALPQQEPATPLLGESVNDVGITNAQRQDEAGGILPFETANVPDHHEQLLEHPGLGITTTLSQADLLAHAAKLLVEISGPEPVHIEMSDRGPKKYYEVKRAITEQDTRAHLKGWKTKGASLRRPDGMTRAFCYDADNPQGWEHLLDAARRLSEAGYLPIVEDSPAGRGGHLWIVYTRLVSAPAAHQHLVHVAPMLQQIKECWPGPGPNKVRLPGGRYIKPGLAVWCKLHDAHGARIAEDGQGAARVLLDYQTSADLVPASSGADSARQAGELAALLGDGVQHPGSVIPVAEEHTTETGRCRTALEAPSAPASLPNVQDEKRNGCAFLNAPGAGRDQHWHEKYNRHLWFQFTPAQLAAWYNERHQVADILPLEKNGMGFASWRGEHTASVGLREDGWVDFGASARRSDGKQDGGDALELTVRVNDEPKPEVMRELARQLVSEAREAVESAAHGGEQPPPWVQAFMSQAGWEHYRQRREEAGHSDQAITEPAPHIRGIVSCSSPDHDTPASQTQPVQEQRQLQDSVQAVSASNPMQVLALLEAIKDSGQASAWAALLLDGEELIPAGRSNWLQFVWLSQQHDQQRRVYEYVRDRSQP